MIGHFVCKLLMHLQMSALPRAVQIEQDGMQNTA